MTDKKVVRVEPAKGTKADRPEWKPDAAANARATKLRVGAFLLWALAIGGEAALVFGLLLKDGVFTNTKMAVLIGGIVVIGLLAIGGSLLWKKANRLDPAHKSDTVRFFVQNQLGAIITLIAFVPLIVLIFLDKDMSKGQKAVAGVVGIVVAAIATVIGIDFDPPSVEQYTAETNQVTEATGHDLVYWTKEGEVFHLCKDVSAVNLKSKDDTIYSGTVADAHAAGKDRLTKQVELERKQCGFDTPDTAESTTPPAP